MNTETIIKRIDLLLDQQDELIKKLGYHAIGGFEYNILDNEIRQLGSQIGIYL